jgi:Ca2+-dependent lipid-binding protein
MSVSSSSLSLLFTCNVLDPFVKVYLLSGGKRVKKKKTAARKSTCNPVWNEALTFNVASSNLSNASVEVRSMRFRDQR